MKAWKAQLDSGAVQGGASSSFKKRTRKISVLKSEEDTEAKRMKVERDAEAEVLKMFQGRKGKKSN